jgi:hypothetical protein
MYLRLKGFSQWGTHGPEVLAQVYDEWHSLGMFW